MDKPSQVYPAPAKTNNSTPAQMPPLIPDPSILGQSFDQLLQQRGVRMLHSKVMPCPNMVGVDNNAHDPNCTFCDSDGFIYYAEKEIWGAFGGNSIQKTFEAHGVWETGTATITLPTEYPDGTEADFNTFDRLIIPDFSVRLWELKEYEPREGGIQELRYPAQTIDRAISIIETTVNNVTTQSQKEYVVGVDFTINTNGQIVWIDGKEPAYDVTAQRGEVISWAFYSVPVYMVVQTLRELRITQELSAAGQKVARRLPQSILVKRDFFPGRGETIDPTV
jgi:hypothetical protein